MFSSSYIIAQYLYIILNEALYDLHDPKAKYCLSNTALVLGD